MGSDGVKLGGMLGRTSQIIGRDSQVSSMRTTGRTDTREDPALAGQPDPDSRDERAMATNKQFPRLRALIFKAAASASMALAVAVAALMPTGAVRASDWMPLLPDQDFYDFQLFAPPDLGSYNIWRRDDDGIYFNYDRLYWVITMPRTVSVGTTPTGQNIIPSQPISPFTVTDLNNDYLQFAESNPIIVQQTTDGVSTTTSLENISSNTTVFEIGSDPLRLDLNTSWMRTKMTWGNRYEGGWSYGGRGVNISYFQIGKQEQGFGTSNEFAVNSPTQTFTFTNNTSGGGAGAGGGGGGTGGSSQINVSLETTTDSPQPDHLITQNLLQKNATEMQSADELLEAFLERVKYYSKIGQVSWNIAQQVLMDHKPDPANSLLNDVTLERGIDLLRFNKEDDTWPSIIVFSAINASDSLAAIQKLIFDEKKYTMEELLAALQANWEGYEVMHQDFLNAPKYGNDDDYADDWAVRLLVGMNDTVGAFKDGWGHPFGIDSSTATGYTMMGLISGASPDGRKASAPLADGSCSPMAGSDMNGPSAVLNSVGKVPFMHTELFNQRFMAEYLEGDNRKLFADYLKVWHSKRIPHIQFNVVSSEVLREAKVQPDEYSDLIVRVAGYSAHFIDLAENTQDSIIQRSEQAFS